MPGFPMLSSTVIKRGLCTNCGTCAAVCPRHSIVMDYGSEEPSLAGECGKNCNLCFEACPGADIDVPLLSQFALGKKPSAGEMTLGVYQKCLKGYAAHPDVRAGGTGGGIVSALLAYALEKGLIDAAVVAGMNSQKPWRTQPVIATTRQEIIANARSKYASAPNNEALIEAVKWGRKVAVVGLPCQIHGLRKMEASGRAKKLAGAVKFKLGIFCGVNSSHIGTEHTIVEVCGVPLAEVAKMEWRGGDYPGRFQVTARDGRVVSPPPLQRTIHSVTYYRDRCLMCYDYPNLLADVAVGDYYHPDMKPGALGWSVFAVRSDAGNSLVEGAVRAGHIHAEPVDPGYLKGAGYEVKLHGAVFRLLERKRHGWPVPDYHLPMDYPGPEIAKAEITPPYAKS